MSEMEQSLDVRCWLKSSLSNATLIGPVLHFARSGATSWRTFLENDFTERAIFPESAPPNRLCHQRATSSDSDDSYNPERDEVAARSPGKASSYLSAMKGEARRDLACHAWLQRNRGRPEPVVDPDNRESCRFHLRNRVFQNSSSTLS